MPISKTVTLQYEFYLFSELENTIVNHDEYDNTCLFTFLIDGRERTKPNEYTYNGHIKELVKMELDSMEVSNLYEPFESILYDEVNFKKIYAIDDEDKDTIINIKHTELKQYDYKLLTIPIRLKVIERKIATKSARNIHTSTNEPPLKKSKLNKASSIV